MLTAFISGHLDVTQEEYDLHYAEKVYNAAVAGHSFVLGDARGCDRLAIDHLKLLMRYGFTVPDRIRVYHMLSNPRGQRVSAISYYGGYETDEQRDEAMTHASDYDILCVRSGKDKSGTAKNLARRLSIIKAQDATYLQAIFDNNAKLAKTFSLQQELKKKGIDLEIAAINEFVESFKKVYGDVLWQI